jgi:hypothetical protein
MQPAPPAEMSPNDRETQNRQAIQSKNGNSGDLNPDNYSRMAFAFANLRSQLGGTLTVSGYRVRIVKIRSK